MKKIVVVHGVNSPPGSWEEGFDSLKEFGELNYLQWPSTFLSIDYMRFIYEKEHRRHVLRVAREKLDAVEDVDLVVTHSFGQVIVDNLKTKVPTINLGGPFSNPIIGHPLRKRFMRKNRDYSYNVLNLADGIPTFFRKKIEIPCKEELIFYKDRFGDDHIVQLYLKQRIVKELVERCLSGK